MVTFFSITNESDGFEFIIFLSEAGIQLPLSQTHTEIVTF